MVKLTRIRYPIAIMISVGLAIFYFVAASWGEIQVTSSDFLFSVASATCAVMSFLVLRKRGSSGVMGTVHLGLFLGMLLWFLGDATWTLYEVGLGIPTPYPSLADAFYLAGYPPLAVGAIRLLWSFRISVKRSLLAAATLLAAFALGATFLFLLEPLIVESTDVLTAFFDLAYPTLDMVVLIPCIFLFLNNPFRGGVMANSWLWISLGIGLTAIGDVFFSHGTLMGWYFSGHPIELFYLWGYVGLALGFQAQRNEL